MQASTLVRELAGEATLVFDRTSVRLFDSDGHLHVEDTNISKATVNPYFGREIPDYERLGLDANKTYRMLRHPAELTKAAATFDGKPLLLHHKPVNALDHAFDVVAGSVTDVRFEPPYLKAKLHIWPREAIDAIESKRKKELSCGYKYRPDMTPGTYDGMPYDGVMRDIVGNHVALVKEGRAGPDVMVGDSQPENFTMAHVLSRKAAVAQGALMAHLWPKIAADERIDLVPALADVTASNYTSKKAQIFEAVKSAVQGKLTQDASVDDVVQLLDKLDTVLPADPSGGDPGATDADPNETPEEKKKRLAALAAMRGNGGGDADRDPDETPEEKKKRLAALAAANAGKGKAMDGMVTQEVMDNSIKLAVDEARKGAAADAVRIANEIREAERNVRPWVGDMSMTFDSAEAVYKQALIARGKDAKEIAEVHPSAYKHILNAMPKQEDLTRRRDAPRPAMDQAQTDDFYARYPAAKATRVVG
jgi:uncharacterized protein